MVAAMDTVPTDVAMGRLGKLLLLALVAGSNPVEPALGVNGILCVLFALNLI